VLWYIHQEQAQSSINPVEIKQQNDPYCVCVIIFCPNRHVNGGSVRNCAAGGEKSRDGGAAGVKSGAAGWYWCDEELCC